MSIEAWPVGVPDQIIRDSFEYKMDDNVLRSEMDNGPEKTRVKYTKNFDTISGSLLMSTTELNTFLTWYRTTLLFGVEQFYFPDPLDNGTNLTCLFVQAPTFSAYGYDHYTVVLGFRVL